jgi:hypothetical protein
MIYDEEDNWWYQSVSHQKNDKALKKEIESWGTHYVSLEEAKAQLERLRNNFKSRREK